MPDGPHHLESESDVEVRRNESFTFVYDMYSIFYAVVFLLRISRLSQPYEMIP